MKPKHWLVKQEPEDYSWDDFVRDGKTEWTGVRNYQARNNLNGMARGDAVLFYHSGDDKAVVGLAAVERAAYPDPSADEPGWVAVTLKPRRALPRPVTLAQIKADPAFKGFVLVRNSRLSVMPVTAAEFARVLALTGA
jgi:predicted RNA-binding protein with PUA-like domain